MATWKKVIVSGSNANLTTLQVDNLTSGQVVIGGGTGNLSTTAINGTGTIVATTGASGLVHSGSFSGSFSGLINSASYAVNAGKVNNALTAGRGITSFTYDGSSPVSIQVTGSNTLTTNVITKWNGFAFSDTSLIDNGTLVTGASSIQLTGASSSLTGSFTGSFIGNGSGLTGLATTLNVSASLYAGHPTPTSGSISLTSQALTIQGTTNEIEAVISGQTVTIGLPNDVAILNQLTVGGDLIVNGTTTTVNTTNLLVEDRFILLSSGSTAGTDGGIVVQSAVAGTGFAFGYDETTDRWVYQDALSGTATAFGTITAYSNTTQYGTAASKPNDATGPAYGGATAGFGNTWVSTDTGEIWMYS